MDRRVRADAALNQYEKRAGDDLRLDGDEVVYAFTQTLRRVMRPTIVAVRTA
jgi:hypothetical protein